MKLTIDLDMSFEDLKTAYRNYYGYERNYKVKKSDVVFLARNLVEADLMDIANQESEDEE
jgi:hypothetical protein